MVLVGGGGEEDGNGGGGGGGGGAQDRWAPDAWFNAPPAVYNSLPINRARRASL